MCFSLLKIIHIGHLKALFQCFMELSSIGSRIKLTDYYNLGGRFPWERRPFQWPDQPAQLSRNCNSVCAATQYMTWNVCWTLPLICSKSSQLDDLPELLSKRQTCHDCSRTDIAWQVWDSLEIFFVIWPLKETKQCHGRIQKISQGECGSWPLFFSHQRISQWDSTDPPREAIFRTSISKRTYSHLWFKRGPLSPSVSDHECKCKTVFAVLEV